MVEADTSRVELSYKKETIFKNAPTGSGVYRVLRYKSDSLEQATDTAASEEIRGDRNITKHRKTGVSVSGDVVCELSKDAGFEELLQSSLQDTSSWTPATPISSTIAVTGVDTITDSGAGFGGIAVGDFIIIHGASNAANNRPMKVATAAAGTLTVYYHASEPLVVESAGSMTLVQGVAIKNEAEAAGTAVDSFTFQKKFSDLSTEFACYEGCTIDGFTIAHGVDDMVTVTFGIVGAEEESPRPTLDKDSGTKLTDGTTKLQFSAATDVAAFLENDVLYDVTGFSVSVTNNHRGRRVAGTASPKSIGAGICSVSGSVDMLFSDSTQIDKHLAYTETSLALMLMNGTQDAYVIEIPSCQFNRGPTVAGGQNQDIIASLPFDAQKEATAPAGESVAAAIRFWKFY